MNKEKKNTQTSARIPFKDCKPFTCISKNNEWQFATPNSKTIDNLIKLGVTKKKHVSNIKSNLEKYHITHFSFKRWFKMPIQYFLV